MSLPEVYARARFEANDELVELPEAPLAFSLRPAQTRTYRDSPHEAAESNVQPQRAGRG